MLVFRATELAKTTIQSDSPQSLTAPVATSEFSTPTMTFGEVGETTQTMTSGRQDKMHGVGIFEAVKILERQRLLTDTVWTIATSAGANLFFLDVLKELQGVADNESIIEMFNFIRADVEITLRLNTNQFYYGALMATLIPAGTGFRLDERTVQSPSIISASSAQAVVKSWDYTFPFEWLVPINIAGGQHPVTLYVDVLSQLTQANTGMGSSITLQVWGRFKNIQLSYPTSVIQSAPTVAAFQLTDAPFLAHDGQAPRIEKQSKVMIPRPSGSRHPAASKNGDEDTVLETVNSLEHITIGDAVRHIPGVSTLFSALSFLVDKPDCTDSQSRFVQDHNVDTYATDIADISTPLVMHRGRYQDPGIRRIPMSSNLTLSQYAQIPGLLAASLAIPNWVFTTSGDSTDLRQLIQIHPDNSSMKTPLDYAALNAIYYRGGIKIMLQFFTSSFVSARFVVQYHNEAIFAATPEDTEYDSTLSRVVNVKGDTTDCFTLPWLHPYSWVAPRSAPSISVTLDSAIASTSTAGNAVIYMLMWVAGAEDIQFAMPRRIMYDTEWSSAAPSLENPEPKIEKQAMIHEMFKPAFPPIVENCASDFDNAYATTEQIDSMADLAKRYGLIPLVASTSLSPNPGWYQSNMSLLFTQQPTTITQNYQQYWQFRQTPFGQMRSAFLFSSGGFRWRRSTKASEYWQLRTGPSDIGQGVYTTTNDFMIRVTVPYSCALPYQALGYFIGGYQVVPDQTDVTQTIVTDHTTPQWLAARDDVMFGWPVLPTGLHSLPASQSEEKIPTLRLSKGKGKLRKEKQNS